MEKTLFPDQYDASASTLPPVSVGASFQIASSTNIGCDPCRVEFCELSKTKRLGGSLNEEEEESVRAMIYDFMAVCAGIYQDRKLSNIPDGYKVELVSSTTVITRIVPKDTTQKVLIDGKDARVIGMAQKMWLSKHDKEGNIPEIKCTKKPDCKEIKHKESCYVCGKKDDTNGVRLNMDGVMGRFFSCAKCNRHWCGECELMQRSNGKLKKCQECDKAASEEKDDYPDSSRIPLTEHTQERVGVLAKNTRTSSSDTETEEHDETHQDKEQNTTTTNKNDAPTMVGGVLPVKNMSEYNMGHMMMGFMAMLGERIQSSISQCPIPYYPPPHQTMVPQHLTHSGGPMSKKRKAEQEATPYVVKKEPKKKATATAQKRQQRPVYTRPISSTPLQRQNIKREPVDNTQATQTRKRQQNAHKSTSVVFVKGKSGTWSRVFRCTKDASHSSPGDSSQEITCLRVRWKKDIVGALAHASKAHGLPHLDWDTTGTEWICKTDGCGYVVSTIPPPITHEELQGHINGMISKNAHASPADWEYDVLNHMRSTHNVHCIISKEEDTSMTQLMPGTNMHFKNEMDSHVTTSPYNGHQQLLIPKMEPITDERHPGAIKLAPITQGDKDADFDTFGMQFHDALAFLDNIPKENDAQDHELTLLGGYMQGMDKSSKSGHNIGLDL